MSTLWYLYKDNSSEDQLTVLLWFDRIKQSRNRLDSNMAKTWNMSIEYNKYWSVKHGKQVKITINLLKLDETYKVE